jgi:hypothetical protein
MSARRPGFCVRAESAKARDRERPVLVDERDDVGDRRERDEVEMSPRDVGVHAEERLPSL